jgi:hypothetical protein
MGSRTRQPRELHNVEAEISLLGAALIGGETVLQFPVVRTVVPPDFWNHRHRDTWAAILAVEENGLQVDLTTAADELEKRGQLGAVGGIVGLTAMVNACLSALHADSYAAVVVDWSRRRQVKQAISGLGAAVYKDGGFEGALGKTIEGLNAVKQGAGANWPVFTLVELLAEETPVPEDIVAGLIPGRAATVVSGPGGDGKSYAMLDLAMCVSRGMPWLGLDTRSTPVLIVDLENRPVRMRERVRRVMRGHALDTPPAVTIAFGLSSRLDGDESVSEIAYLAKKYDAGLVILDSLVDFLGEVDENSNVEMGKAAGRVRAIAEAVGGVLVIHHTPKNNPQTPRGATALRNGVDVNIIVSRDGNHLTLKQDKNRTGPKRTVVARMNWGDGLFNLSPIDILGSRAKAVRLPDPGEEAILNAVDEGGDEWVRSSDVVRQARKATGHQRSTVHRKLKALILDGVLEKRGQEPGKTYRVRRAATEQDDDL